MKAVDYLTRVTERFADNHTLVAKLEGTLEGGLEAKKKFRGLDLVLKREVDLDKLPKASHWRGSGVMKTAELKSGSADVLKVDQGIEHIAQLHKADSKGGYRLFRFIHNTEPALVEQHEAQEAIVFLERTNTIASGEAGLIPKLPDGAIEACTKVMEELRKDVPGLKSWGYESLPHWYVNSVGKPIPARKDAADAAIAKMRKWFYLHFRVDGYGTI